jgi:hypothetical protein
MRSSLTLVAATLAALTWTGASQAGILEIDFTPAGTWTGTPPGGAPGSTILSVVFTDSGTDNTLAANQVRVVITSNLAAGENLDPQKQGAIFLNFNPAKSADLGSLTFALTANTNFSEVSNVMQGEDGFKPDGDGLYDILFTYGSGTKAFTNGESQTYLITDPNENLLASDFNFLSTHSGPFGPFLGAIHVQNTPNGGSGSAFVAGGPPGPPPFVGATPEPTSVVLLGIGSAGLLAWSRRKSLRFAA